MTGNSSETMGEGFRFSLTDQEKGYLKDLARISILMRLHPERDQAMPQPPTDKLRQCYGAFVTLKKRGRLRGCIGNVVGDRPLWETISRMAQAAAFGDPRFPPVTADEYDNLDLEISILSPMEECPDPGLVRIGRHGLVVRKGGRSGLLLPQVPVEWNWDRETFLAHTCLKAGLPETAWQDPDAVLMWFEAEVF